MPRRKNGTNRRRQAPVLGHTGHGSAAGVIGRGRTEASAYGSRLSHRVANPVPREGHAYCDVCNDEVRLNKDGKLYSHRHCPGGSPSVGIDLSNLCEHGNGPRERRECCNQPAN